MSELQIIDIGVFPDPVKRKFNLKTAKKHKLKISIWNSKAFVECPLCHSGYEEIKDALWCKNHCSQEPNEEEKKIAIEKLKGLMQYKKIIDDVRFAVVAEDEETARKGRILWGIQDDNFIYLTPENIDKLRLSTCEILFIGRNYQKSPVYNHPKIQAEVIKQESYRTKNIFALYQDFSQDPMLLVLDSLNDIDTLLEERKTCKDVSLQVFEGETTFEGFQAFKPYL